ncbi:MAG: chromate transporter [Solirubrobacterales bacterium]
MISHYFGFFKTGLLGLGGGIGMLPYLEEIAGRELGLDSGEFLQIVAIAQAFPGAMGVNGAAILGYRMGGWSGALLAITGVTLPSVLFATLLFYGLTLLGQYPLYYEVLKALKAALIGIIFGMVLKLGRKSWNGPQGFALGAAALAAFLLEVNPIFILISGGFLGYLLLREVETEE